MGSQLCAFTNEPTESLVGFMTGCQVNYLDTQQKKDYTHIKSKIVGT